ncbi:MAG: cell envelope integrity protein CreD [Pseudomonadota bacterium]
MAEFVRLPTRSVGLKFLLVCALVLVMAVPTLSVWAVLYSRQQLHNQTTEEISASAGGRQTILGPVLTVPYAKQIEGVSSDGKPTRTTVAGEAVVFAETGKADAKLAVETRSKGIYSAQIFKSEVAITATFSRDAAAKALGALDPGAQFDWSRVRLVMGVSSTTGLPNDIVVQFPNGEKRTLKPASVMIGAGTTTDYRGNAFSLVATPAADLVAPSGATEVKTAFQLGGAERFSIAAFANNTAATISSDWRNPSFEGLGLPDSRDIKESGFTANWSTGLSKRGLAEVSTDSNILVAVASKDFAVKLVEPTNVYTGVDRALKYSIMFIGLVFLAYFMFEIVSGARAHPAQYIMVGLAQAIFYLLLLAFAEQVGFTIAFVIAATATVTLISLYVRAVFKKRVYLVPAFLTFSVVYALMYVLMQLEEYSLLVGSLMSFAALAALMYLTRNVAWYGAADEREKAGA